ncbi:FKBP-type peptidyl-prolyl cis-trans isomerase [Nocardioides sp. R-C-SC26]|uniref:FKBP-type peptidyl-prolyl cis-trans isomerase n=1 Tax=Nocardioides sp. R-C-SC26 TaxID=2870414 RepID=UPI001E65433B|nr:FKBP-type peptidyl-prolyl cis-trans isomerase [Nocardioides sp. R-C-SC26]
MSLRRLRRPVALAAPLLLLSALATACGEKTVESSERDRLDAVEISGDVGSVPEVEWKSRMDAGKAETETLVEGDGEKLVADQTVLVNFWVGNGYTRKPVLNTYADDTPALSFEVGGEATPPMTQSPTEAQVAAYLLENFVAGEVKAGDTIGTRKTVTVDSADVVGYGGGALDIGNADGLLFVIDIAATALDKPTGTQRPKPAWAPSIQLVKQKPGSLNFAGVPAPTKQLRTATLVEGDGEKVESGDVVIVNYLGQTYRGKKPFDGSYERGETFTATLGPNRTVIEGWDRGLVGVPVGSRVLLQIPPDLAYGEQGAGEDIPPNSTLYFVIDVLGAA